MRRFRAIALAAAVVVAAAPARSDAPLPALLQVLGTVTNSARPVASALVIALNLENFSATQTYTTADGSFSLPALRTGIYRIIAVKQGFLPSIATVVPTRASHHLTMRLQSDTAAKKDAEQQLWELRGSLPADILRELDQVLEPAAAAATSEPRFTGEMLSLTGVENQPANPAFAQTALGVQGRIGDSWRLGIQGNLRRFDDPTDGERFGTPLAESSVMSMELRSATADSYRVASTKTSWMYADALKGDQQADVRAHNFEWAHGVSHVQVRYFEQSNLFPRLPVDSNLIEVGGNTTVMRTPRSALDVGVRVTQETVEARASQFRSADVAATGSMELVPSLVVQYGASGRIGVDGQEWAPRTGVQWRVADHTSIVASAQYKMLDRNAGAYAMPNLVFWTDDTRALPRYAYSFGVVSGKDPANSWSATATVRAVDEALRVVFSDEVDQFWDGMYVDPGDVRRDLRLAWRHEFGNRFAVDVSTSAGTATPQATATHLHEKSYLTGDLQSTFTPTRTSLAVSYREIQQPREDGADDYRTQRVHVRMAQSLYLPLDLRVLLGVELAHAQNSPYLVDALAREETARKYLGGLALNF